MDAPKISVIIPLYNAEKFIRECLISVLASTFNDYELLVVDDCSTDNSVAEVEKLSPLFEGRLKILHTEKNSGGPGIPRNIGLKNSAGKYVTFLDNDDLIIADALGKFFDVAESYDADVVYAEKFFSLNGDDEIRAENLHAKFLGKVEEVVSAPTLEPSDISERIRRDMAGKFFILPWGKCYRRDFLLENKIFFPQMKYAEDVTFCFKCLCLAKNYVRIPHMTNIHRIIEGSASLCSSNSANEAIRRWLDIFTRNIFILETFMSTLDLELRLRHEVVDHYFDVHFGMLKNLFKDEKPYLVQKIFFEELQYPALNPVWKNFVAAHLFAERAQRK